MMLILVLISALGAQTWTTVCNGAALGAGSCPISATTMPQARGFQYHLPYDSVNGEFIYYAATPNGTGNTNNASIYSSEIWGYNAGTHTMTYRVGNGASSISAGGGSTRCGQEGSPASTYNPLVGHPQGFFDFDTLHGTLFATHQLCGGQFMGYTALYNATTHTFGTALAKAPFGTGDGTFNATATNYTQLKWIGTKGIYCCDRGSSTRFIIEWNGVDTYTDVTSSVRGADTLTCATSVHCPPAPWTAFAAMSDGSDTLWLYGGCTGTTPGSTGSSNPCNGTNQNDIYKYVVSTKIFTKLSPSGTKPVATYASFPFAAYDSGNARIIVIADGSTVKAYDIAGNSWSTISTTGSGPNFGDGTGNSLANHMDGNGAGWDPINNTLVLIYPSPNGQSTSPIIQELRFGVPITGSISSGPSTRGGPIAVK